jgi:hypothetical protein
MVNHVQQFAYSYLDAVLLAHFSLQSIGQPLTELY